MPKFAISLLCLVLACLPSVAVQVDTVYFDKEWTIMDSPHFAHYYRVLEVGAPEAVKHFRDYYITGEMYEDGKYITFDKNPATYRFVKQGEWTRFYKSGSVMEQGYIDNGKSEGEYTYYYENGSIRRRCNYLHNMRHGLSTDFTQDGLCIQRQYQFDVPTTGYFTVSDENGFFSKVNAADKTPLWETPDPASMETVTIEEDTPTFIYCNDGLVIAMKLKDVSDYGNYYRLYIRVFNQSFFPVNFDPGETLAILTTKNDEEVPLELQSAKMYGKRIRRTQMWEEIVMGFLDGISSTDNSYSVVYQNKSKKKDTEAVYYAPASATNIFGNSYIQKQRRTNLYYGTLRTSTSDTETLLSIQSGIASNLCTFSLMNSIDLENHMDEYLKPCVINPGKNINGYINVKKKKGDLLNVCLTIENAEYNFPFQFVSDRVREKHKENLIEKNFNKVYFKYEKLLNDLRLRDNGEFDKDELEAYKSNFISYQNWFAKESPNLTDKIRKKWNRTTSINSKMLKRLNFIE